MNLTRHLEITKIAAIKAGKQIIKIYNTDFENTIEMKSDNSPITIADKTSNNIIIDILKNEFPDISILSEESRQDKTRLENDLCWIIDPLDGTKEFIKKNGEFTVNIALAKNHEVILGVIYIPVTGVLFYAAKSIGAFKQTEDKVLKIQVTDKIDNLIIVGSKSHASKKLVELLDDKCDLISSVISAGSSLKGTMVAEGLADIYYRFGLTCEWDTAAMQCIIEQAGGIFRQMNGDKMTYNRVNNLNENGFYVVNVKENIWV